MFVLIAGAAATPALIRWPVLLTLGPYVFLLPFESVSGLDGGATLARFVGIVAIGVLLVVGLTEGRLVHPPSAALWWVALVLWAAMTAAWALDQGVVVSRLRTSISLLVLFLVAVSFRISRRELNGLCIVIVIGGVAGAIAGFALGIDEFEAGRRGTLKVGDVATNANAFASSLLPAIALAAAGFLKLRGFAVKMAALGAFAILGGAIFFSISRSAILAIAAIVCVLMYRVGVKWWHALTVILVLVGVLSLMPEHFYTRVTGPVTGTDETGSGRTKIWSVGLEAMKEFWVWGAGLSNFPDAYARHAPVPPLDIARGSHNLYLGTWVELGIIGLVIMLVAIIIQIRAASKGRHSGSLVLYAIEACFFGHLVLAFFGDPLWGKRHWMLLTLLAWASRLATESSTPQVATSEPVGVGLDVLAQHSRGESNA